jgi:hypothetical protein
LWVTVGPAAYADDATAIANASARVVRCIGPPQDDNVSLVRVEATRTVGPAPHAFRYAEPTARRET